MDADGGVELRLGRAELHRDGDSLDDLTGIDAYHVRAHHHLARAVHHQLHEGALLLLSHGELERAERSEEHTSELQSPCNLVCRLLLEKKKNKNNSKHSLKKNKKTKL